MKFFVDTNVKYLLRNGKIITLLSVHPGSGITTGSDGPTRWPTGRVYGSEEDDKDIVGIAPDLPEVGQKLVLYACTSHGEGLNHECVFKVQKIYANEGEAISRKPLGSRFLFTYDVVVRSVKAL